MEALTTSSSWKIQAAEDAQCCRRRHCRRSPQSYSGVRWNRAAAMKRSWRRPALARGPQQPPPPPPVVPRMEQFGDPMSLLLSQRIIFLGTEVNDFTADAVVSQLLLLDAQDETKDIKLFINSPGGSVTAGMGIYDAMQMCRCDVQTICFGLAASMGAFLLTAGTKGKRAAMPNARIMIHQPLGGASGQAVDVEIQAKEIMYHKANLNNIMSYHTGQPVDKIEEDTDRDRYMSPKESVEYGLIDYVIGGDDQIVVPQGLTVTGDERKTKKAYVAWGEEQEMAAL